jgi:alpha,alpha-trehalose phosphorylase
VVAGLGGLRSRYGNLTFAPLLPAPIRRLAFTITFRGQPLRTEITEATATYELEAGGPAVIRHHGSEFTLTAGKPLTLDIPPIARLDRLSQPHGREPARHSERAASRDSGLAVLVVQDGRAAEPAIRQAG